MQTHFPRALKSGDKVRIVAPSRSLAILSDETKSNATRCLEKMGLHISFSTHCSEHDLFDSASIQSRVFDLHEAFADTSISGVLTVIGGFNANQLLQFLDWDLIRNNPKVFCGYSDVTVLNNAIFAQTGLVNYSGPHYSTFGHKHINPFTIEYFNKCLFTKEPFELQQSQYWSDCRWWLDQNVDERLANPGWTVLNEGTAEGTILGANLCTLNLLQGTRYFPELDGSILFLEDDELVAPHTFDRDLQSLIHQPGFEGVHGLVIGRFQRASQMGIPQLQQIIQSKRELLKIPVVAGVDFGHTEPRLTIPIGGTARISASLNKSQIMILDH